MRIDRVKLITEMAKKNISTLELAEKSGVSRVTITAIRGGKACRPATGICIANSLGVDVTDLLETED